MVWTLVTGGAKRLGTRICLSLAQEGYPILVHYNKSEQEARQVAEKCREFGVAAEVIQGDFSSITSTEKFIADCLSKYPDIGNLINNVGNYLVKSALETSLEEWMAIFQTNLHVPFALSRGFMPSLQQNSGNIINMGFFGLNHIRADIQCTAYRIAKTGLLMLTKSLARECAPAQLRVNMVTPGYLEIDPPENPAKLPMQRVATLDEVVRVISFLLQKENAYLTGQNIEVCGGMGL